MAFRDKLYDRRYSTAVKRFVLTSSPVGNADSIRSLCQFKRFIHNIGIFIIYFI